MRDAMNVRRLTAIDMYGTRGTTRRRRIVMAEFIAYAIRLSRPGAVEAELADTDTGRELRRYSLLQFWAPVPLALVGFAVRDILTSRIVQQRGGEGNTDPDSASRERQAADAE